MEVRMANHVIERRGRRKGYTMIEMLIVLCLASLIAVIALPRGVYTTYQLDATARSIRIALQNAQRLSVTRQLNVVVSFDTDHNKIRILEEANNNGAANSGERITWVNLENGAHFAVPATGVNGSVSNMLVGSGLAAVSGLPSITFRRDGASSTELEVYLTSANGRANDYRAITVVQSTGRTDWYKYIDGVWKAGNQ